MAATFPCPHCGATYPLKPVLIGKVVRCTTCKQPFQLQADGVAVKVAAAPAAAPASAPVSAPAPVVPAPAASAPAPAPQVSQRIPRPPSELTRAQEDARRAMSASLTSVIGRMKDPTPPAPSEPRDGGKSDDKRTPADGTKPKTESRIEKNKKSSARFAKASDGKRPKGPAVLTGEGEREAANSRLWTFGAIAVVAVIAGLGWLLSLDGARQQALDAFTAPVAGTANRYGFRLQAIQSRAWVPTVTAFIDLGSTSFGRTGTLSGSTISAALSEVKGLVRHPTLPWWTSPERTAWLSDTAAKNPADKLAAAISKAGVPAVADSTLTKSLTQGGVPEDAIPAIMALLIAPGSEKVPNPWPERLIAGTDLDWCTITGRQGTYLTDPGQNYTSRTADYRGIMIAYQGAWKLATLQPVR